MAGYLSLRLICVPSLAEMLGTIVASSLPLRLAHADMRLPSLIGKISAGLSVPRRS
jgi:hypothetical protein